MSKIRIITGFAFVLSLGITSMGSASAFAHAASTRTAAHHALHVRMDARIVDQVPARPGYAWSTGSTVQFVPGRGIVGESCDLPTSACMSGTRIYN
jgi:hypothetical protein